MIQTVLIEDNPTIRAVLIPAMEELGGMQIVAVAETAAEGVRVLAHPSQYWELAVIDMFLKQGSGLTVLGALEPHPRSQLVVVLTNFATLAVRRECLKLGADKVFDKSTELDQFFAFCTAYFELS